MNPRSLHPYLHGFAVALALTGPATVLWPAAAHAQSNWERTAVPYYNTVHLLQGVYGDWAVPHAQDFERAAQALPPAIEALCSVQANADTKKEETAALTKARSAWQDTAHTWERLSAIAIGPVVTRRAQRAIDFTPTRPALIARAIQQQPQGPQAFELIGTPAKGLPALEWLLWTQPVEPQSPACHYAHEVALDVAREGTVLKTAFTQTALTSWASEDEQEKSARAVSEFVNQWVGGLERLRWAQMEKPLRAAQGVHTPNYPRTASGDTLPSWAATWSSLKSVTALPDEAPVLHPGEGLIPLETYLRGMGFNPLADKLQTAVAEVDNAMAQLPATGTPPDAVVQKTARALSTLKYLAETEVAPALKISIGFSDADGD